MKRAFTLVELLVIVGIVCLLSAAAFPVIKAATAAETIDQMAVSHMKALAAGTLMYISDNDDVFPLTAVVRPDGTKLLGTGLPMPFPAHSVRLGVFGSAWNSAARENMASCDWANSTLPYVKDASKYAIFGIGSYVGPGDNPKLGPTFPAVATMNGHLHHLNIHSVAAPSILPLFWTGNGNINLVGRATAEPVLDCGGNVDDCTFNPNGMPSASGHTTYGNTSYGDLITIAPTHLSYWIFGNNRMPISRVDGSAAMVPVGNVIYPNVAPPGTNSSFPFAQVASNGGPGPDPFNAAGTQFSYWTCNARGVDALATPQNVAYWCFFRPDRTQTIRPNPVP